jgi:hypothetical protein
LCRSPRLLLSKQRELAALARQCDVLLQPQRPVGQDVAQGDTVLCQHPADEQAPVTVARIALAAEQREPMARGAGANAVDRLPERVLL